MENSEAPTNFNDLKEILMNNIKKLQDKSIDISTAKQISDHVQKIVNITKLELNYYKNFQNGNKKIDAPKEIPPTA